MSRYVRCGQWPLLIAFSFACLVLAVPVSADPIPYTSQLGQNVLFENIVEDSGTDPTPLFGSPDVNQNSLVFYPVTFAASATEVDPAADLTDGTLSVTVSALGSLPIGSVVLSERGVYTLGGVGTSQTEVSVAMAVILTILEVDAQPIMPLVFGKNMIFSPNIDGKFNLADDAGTDVAWTGNVSLDVAGHLTSAGISGGATKVVIGLDNVLFAAREDESSASIEKTEFRLDVVPIPEPSCVALLMLGAICMTLRRLR